MSRKLIKPSYFNSEKHIQNLIESDYYQNLIVLRNVISTACDTFFQKQGAPKVDLYMISKGVSSPMGKGSDSEAIPMTLGRQKVFLVDSAQFGMEPLVQNAFEMVYCYLPSFRGEDSDHRHLNQFYHCEAEMRGDYKRAMRVAEDLIKHIFSVVYHAHKKKNISFTTGLFSQLLSFTKKKYPMVSFDEVYALLKKKGKGFIEEHEYGRVLTNKGELEANNLVTGGELPLWITNYDKNVVPFYQKPDPQNTTKVLNADLIFPSIDGAFGGEVLGLGQRQDSRDEMKHSMSEQEVKTTSSYAWYLDLRERKDYKITSGFGLGVERLITWLLGNSSIFDAALYPVAKEEKVYY